MGFYGYEVLRLWGFAVMGLCGFTVLRLLGYGVLRLWGYAVMWFYGYVVLRLCGFTVLWFRVLRLYFSSNQPYNPITAKPYNPHHCKDKHLCLNIGVCSLPFY